MTEVLVVTTLSVVFHKNDSRCSRLSDADNHTSQVARRGVRLYLSVLHEENGVTEKPCVRLHSALILES